MRTVTEIVYMFNNIDEINYEIYRDVAETSGLAEKT